MLVLDPGPSADPVTVLIVDDHPALREGLLSLLEQEGDFVAVGAAASERELVAALLRVRPDVIVLDYALGRGDGLKTCFRIKQLPDPPGVVLYSAYVDGVFAVPATIAQADAVVSKSAPVDILLDAIREVARGDRAMPALDPETMHAASARLDPEDLPIVGLLVAGERVEAIARTLELRATDVHAKALRIIGIMQRGRRKPVESVSG